MESYYGRHPLSAYVSHTHAYAGEMLGYVSLYMYLYLKCKKTIFSVLERSNPGSHLS